MARRTGPILTLAVALSLLIASPATGATRYAAPGGTGADPCATPVKPCSVYTAADKYAPGSSIRAGDVVELAPGTYAELDKEIGEIATVSLPAGVTVRGEPGEARPIIVIRENEVTAGAFTVPAGTEVADVEIRKRSEGGGSAIDVFGGTLNRVIVRSRTKYETTEPACSLSYGTIRSSACISSGGGRAIGVNVLTGGKNLAVIRNSTLIATGPGSVGMDFIYSANRRGLTAKISGVGVLVKGEMKDVVASAGSGYKWRAATVRIDLRSSDYATAETKAVQGGRASVTAPGTNGNIKKPPLLAADNFHQTPGSPTIDKGAVDGASSAFDIDNQPWTMSGLPDIGADEFGSADPYVDPAPATELWIPVRSLGPPGIAYFTFGSSEPGSRFECKLDQEPFRACKSPYEIKAGLGEHRFQVRAVDPQSQVDPTPATSSWRVSGRGAWLRAHHLH